MDVIIGWLAAGGKLECEWEGVKG